MHTPDRLLSILAYVDVSQMGIRLCINKTDKPTNQFNPLMHKVTKMVTLNNEVRRHTGLTGGFQF